MKVILKYIISIILIVFAVKGFAQKTAPKKLERQVFVRFGTDLSRFIPPFINDYGPKGMGFSVDGEVKYRFFPTLEAGFSSISDAKEYFNYEMNGNYFRLGLNYNLTNYKQRLDRDIFFIGARIANSSFSHQVNNINITNAWGGYDTNIPAAKIKAQWVEGLIGLRAEIVRNFYMGFSIRVKSMISHTDYKNLTPYWIPGFGKSGNLLSTGVSYSVFYAIPIKNPKLDFEK